MINEIPTSTEKTCCKYLLHTDDISHLQQYNTIIFEPACAAAVAAVPSSHSSSRCGGNVC